jgi:hypothetical protein
MEANWMSPHRRPLYFNLTFYLAALKLGQRRAKRTARCRLPLPHQIPTFPSVYLTEPCRSSRKQYSLVSRPLEPA